jgi:hypothetical protein
MPRHRTAAVLGELLDVGRREHAQQRLGHIQSNQVQLI